MCVYHRACVLDSLIYFPFSYLNVVVVALSPDSYRYIFVFLRVTFFILLYFFFGRLGS